MRTFLLSLCFLTISLLYCPVLLAQFKVNAGYEFSYDTSDELAELLASYNERYPDALDSFGEMRIRNGVLFGLRYDVGVIGIETNWVFKFSETESILSQNSSEESSINLLGRYHTFSAGLDSHIKWFSYGGSFDYHLDNIKARENNFDTKIDYLETTHASFTAFFGFNTDQDQRISLSFRPFVTVAISDLDYTDLYQRLWETSDKGPSSRPLLIGFKLVFTNG